MKFLNLSKLPFFLYFNKFTHKSKFNILQKPILNFSKKIYNYNNFSKLVQTNLTDGKKILFLNKISKAFKLFFYLFFFKNNIFFNYRSIYLLFLSYFQSSRSFYKINSIINWLSDLLEPAFLIKCFNVPKKFRKKLNKRYTFSIHYLPKIKRTKVFLK